MAITKGARAVRERFCEEYGISTAELKKLTKLVDLSVEAQTREHNEDKPGVAEAAKAATDAVDALAKELKFDAVDWNPGLYPHFKKGPHHRGLPE